MTFQTNNQANFRECLLDVERPTPALRAEYERRIAAMFEVTISRPKRIWFMILTVFCVICAVGAIVLAITEDVPRGVQVAFLVGSAFAIAWAVYLARLVRRGTLRCRIDPVTASGMAWAFSLIMCIIAAVAGLPPVNVLLMGMLTLLPAGAILLRTVIEQAEMRTQERLVELEYKIARLHQKLGGDEDDTLGAGAIR